MVERPIKKADRQERATDSDNPAKSEAPAPKNNSDRGKGKGKGKRDNRREREDAQPPVNLALMRGPKPTKAKAPVLKEADAETEATEATEATEVDATATDTEATADS